MRKRRTGEYKSLSERIRAMRCGLIELVEPSGVVWKAGWSPPKAERPICGAKTRKGESCRCKKIYANGRCKLHGGPPSGPMPKKSLRIEPTMREQWQKILDEHFGSAQEP